MNVRHLTRRVSVAIALLTAGLLAGCGPASVGVSVGYDDPFYWNDYYYRYDYDYGYGGLPDRPDRPSRPPSIDPPVRPSHPIARPPAVRPPISRPAGGVRGGGGRRR